MQAFDFFYIPFYFYFTIFYDSNSNILGHMLYLGKTIIQTKKNFIILFLQNHDIYYTNEFGDQWEQLLPK